jgi:sugar (pentulose or hexulose) kinase
VDEARERDNVDETTESAGAADDTARRRPGAGPLAYVQAIGLGLKDTAGDMLRAGREGAAEAYDEMWDRYEAKTKRRRKK